MRHCPWCECETHVGPCVKGRLMARAQLSSFLQAHRRAPRGTGFHSRIAMPCDCCSIPTRADLLSERNWCPGCEHAFRQVFRRAAA